METAGQNGTLALVGAGEFLPEMNDVDRELLRRCRGRRVAILPTASAPDGPGVPERWAKDGVTHFQALGAQAVGVMALDRQGCHHGAPAGKFRPGYGGNMQCIGRSCQTMAGS